MIIYPMSLMPPGSLSVYKIWMILISFADIS